jgi:hypothetical protein
MPAKRFENRRSREWEEGRTMDQARQTGEVLGERILLGKTNAKSRYHASAVRILKK